MTAHGVDPSDQARARALVELVARRSADIVTAWTRLQISSASTADSAHDSASLTQRNEAMLTALSDGLAGTGRTDLSGQGFEQLRQLVGDNARRGVRQGATPVELAYGMLTLREAFFDVVQSESSDAAAGNDVAITAARVVDALALLSFDTYVRGREEVILRQNTQLFELSTPVVRLWDGIVGVPLVGTLDSARAQVVMETLLQAIVDEHARVAILDITGVPTVDTLVAQHLLKTVTATRLMGADCIISGIRPQTAQTIVQLGIDLAEITTRATLADALATAIARVAADGAEPSAGR